MKVLFAKDSADRLIAAHERVSTSTTGTRSTTQAAYGSTAVGSVAPAGTSASSSGAGAIADVFDGLLHSPLLAADARRQAACLSAVLSHQTASASTGAPPASCTAGAAPSQRAVEVVWAHSTRSFALGFLSSSQKEPSTFVSRLPADQSHLHGQIALVGSDIVPF